MPPTVTTSVRKVKGQTYLQGVAYGETELHRIVSYRDGVLVIDISRDGKAGSKKIAFRKVLVATPHSFDWTP